MANGWRPTTSEGLLAHLSRETRIQSRNRAPRINPLLQDVVDASQATDNIPPGDVLDTMDPDDIPIFDPGALPDTIDTSSDPANVTPNSSFTDVGADGRPVSWNAIWDFGQEPNNPLRWDGTPGEARTGLGRAVLTFTTGWQNNVGIYSSAAMAVVAGARYLAEVYAKSTVTGSHEVIAALITGPAPESTELFAAGSAYFEIGTIPAPSSAYANIASEIVIPAGHRFAKWLIRGNGTTTTQTGEVSIDDVSLVQLSDGTVRGGVPWYAHPRTGPYDPQHSLYNVTASSLGHGRTKLIATKAGDRNVNIMTLGDSVTAGFGGPGVRSWTSMLLKELEREGCIIKSDGPTFVGVGDSLNNYTPDPRWTFSGTVNTGPWSIWASINNGSWAQFAASRKGTILKINYFHTGGNFTYSIDGGAAVAVTTNGSSTMGTVTVGGLSDTLHTIRVTGSSATPAEVISVDFEAAVSGLRVYSAGVTQITTAQMIDTSMKSAMSTGLAVGTPDIVLVSLGINDAAGSLDVQTYEDWMRTIVRHCKKQGGATVAIVAPPHTADYDMGHWAPYPAALYNVADKEDVALLDLTDIWGQYNTASSAGLFHDTVHPSPSGHANYAHAVRQMIL